MPLRFLVCLLLQLMLQPSCYRTGPDDNQADRMTCFLLSNPRGTFAAWNCGLQLAEIRKVGQRQRLLLMLSTFSFTYASDGKEWYQIKDRLLWDTLSPFPVLRPPAEAGVCYWCPPDGALLSPLLVLCLLCSPNTLIPISERLQKFPCLRPLAPDRKKNFSPKLLTKSFLSQACFISQDDWFWELLLLLRKLHPHLHVPWSDLWLQQDHHPFYLLY